MLLWKSVFKYLNLVFSSLGYTPTSEIAGSSVCSLVNLLRNCQNVFQSSCPIPHCHPHCTKVPNSLHLNTTCYFLFLNKNYSHSGGCEIVLICMFLMTNNVIPLTSEIFSNVFWPSNMLTNVYSSTLPTVSVFKRIIVHFPLPCSPFIPPSPPAISTLLSMSMSPVPSCSIPLSPKPPQP